MRCIGCPSVLVPLCSVACPNRQDHPRTAHPNLLTPGERGATQGWAFVGWSSAKQASSLKSFIDATPKGKFNVIDMSVNGSVVVGVACERQRQRSALLFTCLFSLRMVML